MFMIFFGKILLKELYQAKIVEFDILIAKQYGINHIINYKIPKFFHCIYCVD
jgi:hypothetical protein